MDFPNIVFMDFFSGFYFKPRRGCPWVLKLIRIYGNINYFSGISAEPEKEQKIKGICYAHFFMQHPVLSSVVFAGII